MRRIVFMPVFVVRIISIGLLSVKPHLPIHLIRNAPAVFELQILSEEKADLEQSGDARPISKTQHLYSSCL